MSKGSQKKSKGEKTVFKTPNTKTVAKPTDHSFKRHTLVVLVVAILLVHVAIQLVNIDRPFYAANDDDNTAYGLAAYNLARFGF